MKTALLLACIIPWFLTGCGTPPDSYTLPREVWITLYHHAW